MASYKTARERFNATRRAVKRLNEVHLLIIYDCDDWQPEGVHVRATHTPDPTANRAIFNADERGEMLAALRTEERELTSIIGESLRIIAAVRDGFGEIYATLLESRYIDCATWKEIHDDHGIPKSTGNNLVGIAFDWIDSVGVSRLLKGEVEL